MLPKNCPINKSRKRTPKKNLEAQVVRECLQFLAKHPQVIYVERRNTGAVQFQDGGFVRFGQKGAADIWCLIKINRRFGLYGHTVIITHIEIECKRSDGRGRQSETQKKFQEFCDSRHIPYILTNSASHLAGQISAIILDK